MCEIILVWEEIHNWLFLLLTFLGISITIYVAKVTFKPLVDKSMGENIRDAYRKIMRCKTGSGAAHSEKAAREMASRINSTIGLGISNAICKHVYQIYTELSYLFGQHAQYKIKLTKSDISLYGSHLSFSLYNGHMILDFTANSGNDWELLLIAQDQRTERYSFNFPENDSEEICAWKLISCALYMSTTNCHGPHNLEIMKQIIGLNDD